MTILALDPSSVRCGYAVFDTGKLVECGLLKPRRRTDHANDRIESMAQEAGCLIHYPEPDDILIEDTSGKVGQRHGGKGAGLAVYGKAVGYMWAFCAHHAACADIHLIPENTWTRGKPKAKRQTEIALLYRKLYDPASDPGGDAADAIGLGLWWIEEGKVRNA